jgi:hypothetical protein
MSAQGEEQRLQEADAATTATGLQEEEIKLLVKNEVRAGLEECTQGLREQIDTLEKLMRMFLSDAAEERERREAEAEERLREEREEAAAAARRTKKSSGGEGGGRTERGGGTRELSRLMKSLLRGGTAEDEESSDTAGGEEAEEEEEGGEKSKEPRRKSKSGSGGTREEIRALLQNGGTAVPTTFGKLDDAELALKAAAMLDNTSFNLDKTMVKGAQRGRFGYEENGVVIEHLASISSEKMCITSGSLEHDEVVLAQTEGGRDVVMKTKESKAPTTLVDSGYDLSDRIRNLGTIMKALYPLNKQVQQALKELLSEVKACNIYYGNRMDLALARHISSEINHALREWYGAVLNTLDTILRTGSKVLSSKLSPAITPSMTERGAGGGGGAATVGDGEGLEILPGVKLPTLNFSKLIASVQDNASRRMLIMILKNGSPSSGRGGGDPGNKPGPSKAPPGKKPGAGGGAGAGGAGGKGAGGGAIMQLFKDPSNRNYCFDWLNGRCSADPCRFVHDDSMSDQTKGLLKRAHKLLQTAK